MTNKLGGFNYFYGTVYRHDEIHVYLDSTWPRSWRVRGLHGDFGLFSTKDSKARIKAIECAINAKVSLLFDAKIYVHKGFKTNENNFIITKIKNIRPGSQCYQDNGE